MYQSVQELLQRSWSKFSKHKDYNLFRSYTYLKPRNKTQKAIIEKKIHELGRKMLEDIKNV